MVSGLNHLLGRVKRSDLVQSGRDTAPDVVGGLTQAQELSITIISLWERPEQVTWVILALWGPLEAKPNRHW